jgi:hypothetical protein
MLQFEGWDVWKDHSDPSQNAIAAFNTKVATAGAVPVLWSDVSRRSPYARSEAAIGLAKNKLIQVSLDGDGAPASFGQLEILQLQGWAGERHHWRWRRLKEVVSLYAGATGAQSLLLQSRPAASKRFPGLRRRKPLVPFCMSRMLRPGWMPRRPTLRRATRRILAASPPTGVDPGAMPVATSERIGALRTERRVAWMYRKV